MKQCSIVYKLMTISYIIFYFTYDIWGPIIMSWSCFAVVGKISGIYKSCSTCATFTLPSIKSSSFCPLKDSVVLCREFHVSIFSSCMSFVIHVFTPPLIPKKDSRIELQLNRAIAMREFFASCVILKLTQKACIHVNMKHDSLFQLELPSVCRHPYPFI